MQRSSSNPGDSPPRDVRDWIFSDNGVFPAAGVLSRAVAFLLDAILVGALTLLLLTRIVLPQFYAEETRAFETWSREYWKQQADRAESGEPARPARIEDIDEGIWRMLLFAQNFTMLLFWIYFGAAESFFAGQTLGKRTFRLKVVDFRSLYPLSLRAAMIRSFLKTLCLFVLFPVLLANYLVAFFLPYRRAGHDLLARSVVVEDNTPSSAEEATQRPPDTTD